MYTRVCTRVKMDKKGLPTRRIGSFDLKYSIVIVIILLMLISTIVIGLGCLIYLFNNCNNVNEFKNMNTLKSSSNILYKWIRRNWNEIKMPHISLQMLLLNNNKYNKGLSLRWISNNKNKTNKTSSNLFEPTNSSMFDISDETALNDIHLVLPRIIHLKDRRLNQKSQINDLCDIYCHGDLLHTVEMAHIYKDSKTFVDKKLKYRPKQILSNWSLFRQKFGNNPTKDDIRQFVDDNFDPESSQFDPWDPVDWKENPSFLNKIRDPQLRLWAQNINKIWKELGRKIKDDVRVNQDQYSLIYVSNPVIIPGGRFVEFYYWDSYWIIQGLLHSEMNTTVRGMLLNFIELIETIGYVPNGGRIYYERSQPPLLIPMVKLYLDKTNDIQFLRANIGSLVKEFHFWLDKRSILVNHHGKEYRLIRYNVKKDGPRPESYREDYELAQEIPLEMDKKEFYYNLKSSAESGWDFSSRWFKKNSKSENPNVFYNPQNNLTLLYTRNIIPVDLNSFFYLNARLLQEFFVKIGNPSGAEYYKNIADEWKQTINEVFWDESLGCWFDLDLNTGELRTEFFPSNVMPLWVQAQENELTVSKVVSYLKKTGCLDYPGGVPTSMEETGQQWDFPNGWANLQHMMVEALEKSGSSEARQIAFSLAEKWVLNVFTAYQQSQPNALFEKYNVTVVGLPGGGGEYEIQVGFGWTNGVILDFLDKYGSQICTCCSPLRSSAKSTTFVDTNLNTIFTNYNIMMALSTITTSAALSGCKITT